jgi:hypothetical protein
MEVLAMRLHGKEWWKLRQIEEDLRREDPGLDTLLAGRPPPRRPAPRTRAAWALAVGVVAAYLVPPALLSAGLVLPATGLVVAGAVLCPVIPGIAWLLIRRHSSRDRPSRSRKP